MKLAQEKLIYVLIILFATIIVPFIAYFKMRIYIVNLDMYHFIMPTGVGLLLGFGFGNFYLLRQANKKLKSSHLEYKQLVDNISGRYALYRYTGKEGVLTHISKGSKSLLGFKATELIGKKLKNILQWTPEVIKDMEIRTLEMTKNPNKIFENEFQFIDKDGRLKTLTAIEYANINNTNNLVSFNGLLEDVSDVRIGELQMMLLSNVFSHIQEAMIITDINAKIININTAFTDLTGYTDKEVIGRHTNILKSGEHNQKFYEHMWQELIKNKKFEGELWNKKKNGDKYYQSVSISAMLNDNGQTTHYIGLLSDITEKKLYEEQLKQQALFDPLTQLPNRVLLNERIDNMIAQSKRNNLYSALAFMDLDKFKKINDTYGHEAGDFILKTVAKRVQKLLRETDTIARLGGDEFVILLTNIVNKNDVDLILNKIIHSMMEPIMFECKKLQVLSSIGVSFYSNNITRDELLSQADKAMYYSKEKSQNKITYY